MVSDEETITKQLLYEELSSGKGNRDSLFLRYKDSCERDVTSVNININQVETLAMSRSAWRTVVQNASKEREICLYEHQADKHKRAREARNTAASDNSWICSSCSRQCRSTIGLYSYEKNCKKN